MLGVAGYTSYAPSKAAVRSLADTLRNEVCFRRCIPICLSSILSGLTRTLR